MVMPWVLTQMPKFEVYPQAGQLPFDCPELATLAYQSVALI